MIQIRAVAGVVIVTVLGAHDEILETLLLPPSDARMLAARLTAAADDAEEAES